MRFLLFAQPRTGTTAFREILNQQREIYCYGEVLYPDNFSWGFFTYLKWMGQSSILPTELRDHLISYLDSITGTMEDAGKKHIGFDFKIPQINLIPDFHVESFSQNFGVIHLDRRNPLEAVVSYRIMLARNLQGKFAHGSNTPNIQAIDLNPRTILSQLRRFVLENQEIYEIYGAMPTYLRIYYEDLFGDERPKVIEQLSNYFDLKFNKNSKNRLVKQNPAKLSEKISNIEEIKESLNGSEFENILIM